MSGAEDPDISVARGKFIVILISIFILFSIAIFYHIVGQESIETYVDILWAIGPTLLLIAGILSYWFFFSTVGNPILNILLGNVYINIINSVYFRSRVRLLRRRFFPRNTSLQHLLTSKVYKRITNRIDSKFLVGFHYIVVLAIVLSLSISTTYIFVQENTLYLGDIWDRSTIWTIARLHFASLSLGLVMIVFALNFLERNISPLEHGSVLVRSTLIIRIIIISTTISVSILLIPLLSDQISDTIYKYIVVFNFVLFPIVLLSIFVIMEKIIQIFLSSPDEIHLSSVKSKIVKLAIMGREKEYATEILDSVSMGISNEVAESSTPYAQITAHDIGAKPGDYIVDINKKL